MEASDGSQGRGRCALHGNRSRCASSALRISPDLRTVIPAQFLMVLRSSHLDINRAEGNSIAVVSFDRHLLVWFVDVVW